MKLFKKLLEKKTKAQIIAEQQKVDEKIEYEKEVEVLNTKKAFLQDMKRKNSKIFPILEGIGKMGDDLAKSLKDIDVQNTYSDRKPPKSNKKRHSKPKEMVLGLPKGKSIWD